MDKTNCYKCDKESSAECGECAVWIAHEEVSEKERNAYKQGVKDGYNKAVDDIIDLFGCSDEDIYAKETIREWLNNVKKEKR